MTPAAVRPCRIVISPNPQSWVMTTRPAASASARTRSSLSPRQTSLASTTSKPRWIRPSTIARATHSSAKKAGMLRSFGSDDPLMGQIVCRVGLCRADILDREMWVIGENMLDGVASGETPEDMLDRDSGAGDYRLAHHDLGVALNACVAHVVGLLGR